MRTQAELEASRQSLEGLCLGAYRVRRLLSSATVGEPRLLLAEHAVLGRPAVVKVLGAETAAEASLEIEALAAVSCEFIPALLDAGKLPDELGGTPYLVTEYAPGDTLAQLLQQHRRLGARRSLALGVQLVEALAALHDAGFLHGDIKPDNLVIVPSSSGAERLVVVDFGACRKLGQRPSAPPVSTTRTRFTPEYAPPEVLERAAPHPTQDVFAVGCVLYECIAGTRPDVSRLHAPSQRVEPLSRVVPLSEDYSKVVARALLPRPDARYQSARELLSALLAIPTSGLVEDCHQRWAALPGHQESLATVDVSDVGRRVPQGTIEPQSWRGDVSQLLSTEVPEIWALAGDPAMDQPELISAILQESSRYQVSLLDAEARERKSAQYLAGGAPPAVVIFGDLHVLLEEPLLMELCKQGETARLLVSTHPNSELLQSTINNCGLHAQLCLPDELTELPGTLGKMVVRARRTRQRYDWLRLALRDTYEDLKTLRHQFAKGPE